MAWTSGTSVGFFLNNEVSGRFDYYVIQSHTYGCNHGDCSQVALADLDLDGDLDVCLSCYGCFDGGLPTVFSTQVMVVRGERFRGISLAQCARVGMAEPEVGKGNTIPRFVNRMPWRRRGGRAGSLGLPPASNVDSKHKHVSVL